MLAAGSGRRLGRPKALVDTGSGPWVVETLDRMSGCDERFVVIGAEAAAVAALLSSDVRPLINPEHHTGMGSSLIAGLRGVSDCGADVALVMLVDLPDVTRTVLDRLVRRVRLDPDPTAMLARATYGGRPGHPVVIGRRHFAGVMAGAAGDTGARDYLEIHSAEVIECGDVGGGRDVDTVAQPGSG